MAEGAQKIVWLVDDSGGVRRALAALLEAAGMTVWDFESAEAFLRDFRAEPGGWLVVDQQMPGMTGLELLQHLKDRQILPSAILISAGADEILEQRARAAGAIAVFRKPVDGEELIALIETAQQRSFATGA